MGLKNKKFWEEFPKIKQIVEDDNSGYYENYFNYHQAVPIEILTEDLISDKWLKDAVTDIKRDILELAKEDKLSGDLILVMLDKLAAGKPTAKKKEDVMVQGSERPVQSVESQEVKILTRIKEMDIV